MGSIRTVIINPTNLTPSQAGILQRFLMETVELSQRVWFPENQYTFKSPIDGEAIKIKLTHHVVYRTRLNPLTKKNEPRYTVFNGKEAALGAGTFGHVYNVLGTLKPSRQEDQGLVFDTHKPRVIKVINYASKKEKENCLHEASISLDMAHLHAKPATVTSRQIFIVMRKFPGVTLEKYLEDNGNALSVTDRLFLSLRLLSALKTQIHLHKKVHRDIKPSNIIISEDETNIIDFGFSVYAKVKDYRLCGTKGFVAPEAYSGGASLKKASDIYSLGAVLALVWNAEWRADSIKKTIDTKTLLKNVGALYTEESSKIKFAIELLLSSDAEHRLSLDQAVSIFSELYASRYRYQSADEFKLKDVRDIFTSGFELRDSFAETRLAFKAVCQQLAVRVEKLQNFDHPAILEIFHQGHGLKTLRRYQSATYLLDFICKAQSRFTEYLERLRYLIAEGSGVIASIKQCDDVKLKQENHFLISQCENRVEQFSIFEFKLRSRQGNFDETIALLTKLTTELPEHEAAYRELLASINQSRNNSRFVEKRLAQFNQALGSGNDVKSVLVSLLQEYWTYRRSGTVPSFWREPVSHDRLQVMNEIMDIAESPHAQEFVVRQVGDKLKSLRTSWFFTSTLESKLISLIQSPANLVTVASN